MDWIFIGIFIGLVLSGIIIGSPVGYLIGRFAERKKINFDYAPQLECDDVLNAEVIQ